MVALQNKIDVFSISYVNIDCLSLGPTAHKQFLKSGISMRTSSDSYSYMHVYIEVTMEKNGFLNVNDTSRDH